jgi:iron complex outermembrane recepter protein
MKNLVIILLFYSITNFAQVRLTGKISDAGSHLSLPNANIIIENSTIGTSSDRKGEFTLIGEMKVGDILKISYVGFTTRKITLSQKDFNNPLLISLAPAIVPSQTVLVEASLGQEGVTPVTFQKITKDNIEKNYVVQDIPQFLGELPSTTFYSENGNGIGYNYLSIRGFDQRRISISINGIPQNDPEDHDVYWLDFPDLLASTDFIQVQRGAGSGIYGYPAIGGSINIITSSFTDKPEYNISTSVGSYDTRKYTAFFSSGPIDNKYSFSARVSQILSSGYRDLSWTNFISYYLSAVRIDGNFTSQLNLYGGPISDGLAYYGLPKFAIADKNLRRKNYSYWEASSDSFTYTIARRPEEIENFSQPHYELLNEYKLGDDIVFNSALFYVAGVGFFNYDGSYGDTTYFRLTNQNGFAPSGNPGNTLIGAWVSNKQGGWIPRFSWKHSNGELIAGAEFRIHRSEHWGNISYAENLPPGVTSSYQYYYYRGAKDMISGFIHESYQLNDNINLLGELQLAYNKYRLYDEKYVGTDFYVANTFLNPRFGINYKYKDNSNVYFSISRISREPRLSDYYNAAESSGGSLPQFFQNPDGSFNFKDPLVHPETMNDLELGASYGIGNLVLSANMYLMIFNNEIVNNGQLDQFGVPITGNIKSTIHRGLEISSLYKTNMISFFGNVTFSKNYISEGKYYVDSQNYIDLAGNRIGGFPDFLLNWGITFNKNNWYFKMSGKYVGAFFSDNYDTKLSEYLSKFPVYFQYSDTSLFQYTDNKNNPYFTMDFLANYSFKMFNGSNETKVFFLVNNIFDRFYSANAIGAEFFPGAERNFILGIKLGL